jgi:AraC-like DNA-binding protein
VTVSKLIDIIIYAGILQGFFLAFILTTAKNRKRKPNRILAALLILLSISILHSVISIGHVPIPYKIREPFILLIGPMLLLYIREFTETKMFNLKDAFHFLPFLLFFLILLPIWVHGTTTPYGLFLFENAVIITRIGWALVIIQYGYYWWKILRILKIHRSTIETEFSSIEGKTFAWMHVFLLLFGIFFIVLTIILLIAFHSDNYDFIDKILSVALSFTIFILGYYGLFQEEVFSNLITAPSTQNEQPEKEESSKEVTADAANSEEVKRIIAYLEDKKPYLDESLTLTKLAEKLNMTRNQLSGIINNNLKSSFYDFINGYRVEEVKRLIADPENKNFTILALAFDSGFSSKSAFNNIFKKITGLTPTAYKKNLQ